MTTKNTILCTVLAGFWMLAAPAQSEEDLKAYYEKQKAEIEKNFTGPELKSKITIVLKDGEEKTGVLRQLSDNGVQLLVDGALVTYRKRELDEASCAKLFAEEYAHAEAIKRTRAYKRGSAARKQRNTHKGGLSVNATTKRSSDLSHDSEARGSSSMDTEEKMYSKIQKLTISVANRTTHPDTYSLKWYFFVQQIGTDNVAIHSSGSEEIELEGRQKVEHKVASKVYDSKKVTKSWNSCPTCSTSETKVTGSEGQGYLVLLKCGDEILDKKASSKRYLNPDWVMMCR